ncbi:MAG: YggU family protein [Desulfobulbaceae bacterium]|nr:YggU family protein [Desulfobulbaceae bacterium]
MPYLSQDKSGGIALTVHVQPKASRNRIIGLHGDALKISITAPPVEGKANKAIISFLAGLFHIPKSAITLKSGQQSRTKRFLLSRISPDEVRDIIDSYPKT